MLSMNAVFWQSNTITLSTNCKGDVVSISASIKTIYFLLYSTTVIQKFIIATIIYIVVNGFIIFTNAEYIVPLKKFHSAIAWYIVSFGKNIFAIASSIPICCICNSICYNCKPVSSICNYICCKWKPVCCICNTNET